MDAMDTRWTELSDGLATLVERHAPSVVRVGRGRRAGSGLVWSPDGVVVTAAHVLGADDEVTVGLPDGSEARAEVVGADGATDLAVVRVSATGLPGVVWEEAPLRTGQLALSLSRPGRNPRAALGLVARLGDAFRTHAGGRIDRWVELDFGLFPGFSGSLVLDLGGRALGLASAGLARETALAVPPGTLRRVVRSLLDHGAVRRGWLGVATLPVKWPAAVERSGAPGSALLVTAVEPESPAARAGLFVGDLLLALDGVALAHVGDLFPLLEEERIGEVAVARIWRAGAAQEVEVTVGARGERAGGNGGKP